MSEMGVTAIISSSSSSASAGISAAVSLLSPVGLGVGGIFVAAALVVLLAYLDLFDASELDAPAARTTVLATIVPLGLTFGAIVLFKSLQVV